MTTRATEAGADALRHHERGGSRLTEWSRLTPAKQRLWTDKINTVLHALKAEGFVVVPKETFFEIANRAGNMSDPDAADWLPSIYRIAMEAAGEDPWPTLRLHGYDPDNISASFDTMAKNGEARAAAQEPTCK